MSKDKKPQAGEYWIHDKTGEKAYFIGKCPAGVMVWQCEGDDVEHGDLDWSEWHHEPRCTGWDWQPEPEQKWFDLTPHDEHVLRADVDEGYCTLAGRNKWVEGVQWPEGTTVSDAKSWQWDQFRCLLKDAPPELLKPAESPDDWVEITHTHPDHVPRVGIDQFDAKSGWETQESHHTTQTVGEHLRSCGGRHRCRRKYLPPIPVPKPATQREVLLYWYDGNVVGRYADCPPSDPSFVPLVLRDGKVFIETETREVVR